MANKKREYDSIIDNILDEREPDYKDLDMKDAKVSGDDLMNRTHQYVDSDWLSDIAESASHHTPISHPKSGSKEYTERIAEKEALIPRIGAVQDNWHKDARRDAEDYRSSYGDNDSLLNELTMTLDKAESENRFGENSVEKKSWTDGQIQNYVRGLLNQGMSPSKVAAKLEKIAEIELFNHQSATDYLQRNAGLMGLAYMEPNTYMDKSSPTYEHTASKKQAAELPQQNQDQGNETKAHSGLPYDTNGPIDYDPTIQPDNTNKMYKRTQDPSGKTTDEFVRRPPSFERTLDQHDPFAKENPSWKHSAESSNDCVRQHDTYKQAGIKIQARSVKQIKACTDCSYFKKNGSSKTCNLYHLPLIANTEELTQIVNHLTPGVPAKRKHAALVAIANREDQHTQSFNASTTMKTNMVKTADARVKNQQKRASSLFSDDRENQVKFSSEHVGKMHDKGASLDQIYKWASGKFGDVDTSLAFRGFVQNFKKDAKGKIIVATNDLKFLQSIGIRNEAYQGAAKCASCPTHFIREVRASEENRGAQRADILYSQSTPEAVRSQRKEAKVTIVNADVVRKLHCAGHSLEKIFKGASVKVGSVQAKRAMTDFVAAMKKTPTKAGISESDRSFLVGKLGMKPESVRLLDPLRRPVNKVVASVPTDAHVMSYPGMGKQAGETVAKDGHSILAEYDLTNAKESPDIDISGPNFEDVQINSTYKV